MSNAYYCPILFEGTAGDAAGVIYCDEDDSLIRIAPVAADYPVDMVKLDGKDLVSLLRLAMPLFTLEQIEEIAAIIKPIQDAFAEE